MRWKKREMTRGVVNRFRLLNVFAFLIGLEQEHTQWQIMKILL